MRLMGRAGLAPGDLTGPWFEVAASRRDEVRAHLADLAARFAR